MRRWITAVLGAVLTVFATTPAWSAPPLDAIVSVRTVIPADARLARVLGQEREGSGVVIDDSGLIVTVGYIMMEAREVTVAFPDGRVLPAQTVAYDHETGFGLLRTLTPPGVEPAQLGSARDLAEGDDLTFVSLSDGGVFEDVTVASRRTFAGYWEYLLEDALFTTPAMPGFAGAALFDSNDRLVGIGSLYAADAPGLSVDGGPPREGNMAIPIDALMPVFADLLAVGRRQADITPWVGLTLDDTQGFLIAVNVSSDGPAAKAGLRRGDVILKLGDRPVRSVEAYMRVLRGAGDPGVDILVDYFRPTVGEGRATVETIDRIDWLKLNPSY